MRKHIITIAGKPGSGKSTTAKAVASKLGFKHFSSGGMFRELAKNEGIDVLQANYTAENRVEIDYEIDNKLQELSKTGDQLVIDSRMAWHWMPTSFKVFLDLDLEVASQRIINQADEARMASEHIPSSPNAYAQILQERLASESRRYQTLYHVDPFVMSNYDLVIDTGLNDIKQTTTKIVNAFQGWIST